ncbi:hypothetical protein [Saccharothrix luteola]|uniref:hypothetical protein n=1 Tax=Saccharothrix luteola TaxID=2893018 RepID=UPI001E5AC084|nr:hypothetical protein [Saccharothrix luteola]MCC8249782.1 hypothetical protein [Saccharothrix luteola]
MLRKKIAVLVAGLGIMGSVLVGGSATAASSADQNQSVGADGWLLVQLAGSGGNAPPENCRALTSPGGARLSLCSAYGPNGDGTVSGYYRLTVSGETFAQIRVNGGVVRSIITRPDARGIFDSVTSVSIRACNSVDCGAWG